MPFRLTLIYILCCLIDGASFLFHQEWLVFLGTLPVLCLLCFYTLRRRGEHKLKDYTYTIGLILAAIADIIIELQSTTDTVLAMVFYMLSYSFYIAAVRKETSFSASPTEILKLMVSILLMISPILIIFSEIPSDYFFALMLYMVFLALLYASALLRKTNKSSYQWFLTGSICFVIVTICKVYFLIIIKLSYDDTIIKILYDFAQYAIFVGIVKSFKNFYPANEK